MADSFTHLHVHTEYSMLDGAARIKEVVEAAAADGQPALGITDHGNMYGILDFYKECRSQGIKPILGSELYMAHESRHERPSRRGRMDDGGGDAVRWATFVNDHGAEIQLMEPGPDTHLGKRLYNDELRLVGEDGDGRRRYQIYGFEPSFEDEPGTDLAAVARKRIAITPVHFDLTDRDGLTRLRDWDLDGMFREVLAGVTS